MRSNFQKVSVRRAALAICATFAGAGLLVALPATPAGAQQAASTTVSAGPTYADLVDLADPALLVLRAKIRRQAELEPERAPGLAPGHTRLYIEAETQSLLSGTVPIGESLRYLVDLPLDEKGKAPKLKRQEVILFARPVRGRPGELQLVKPGAQLPWTPELETRLRPILAELVAPDAPPRISEIRDALSVAGNLVGESETQLFIETENSGPVSITVVRRPGMEPQWGVSWTEIVDQSARPPQGGTLEWYRLACALPATLPASANLSRDPQSRNRAARDYALVMEQLGPCLRNRS